MAAPTDDTRNTPTSLAQRAPAGPIPTRIRQVYLRYSAGFMGYKDVLEQKNQYVRSRQAHMSIKFDITLHDPQASRINTVNEATDFPYPTVFRKAILAQHDEENRGRDFAGENATSGQTHRTQEEGARLPVELDVNGQQTLVKVGREWSITNRIFGIMYSSTIEYETQVQPVYVVLGIFPRGYPNPRERVVFIHKPKHLFWKLSWAAFRLRGLSSTLFSLRHVRGFRVYRVCNS